jgi:diguanylate cyclase (GGDEF)-like protein
LPPAPLPASEAERLAALESYEVLDTSEEAAFDDLVDLAARLTNTPIALISLVDAERQWFKARHGIDVTETPRGQSICAHAILDPQHPLAVADLRQDERFRDNPLVTGGPGVRAYLGVPLVNPEGHALGTLCVVDHVPRSFDAETVQTLTTLGRAAGANLELRRSLRREHHAATTDALTGLPNRRAVMERLSALLTGSQSTGIVAVDLDFFKEANDSEGHAAGDALLRATAARLTEAAGPGNLVGRVGGDEFVLLLKGEGSTRLGAHRIALRVSGLLHQPVPYGPRQLRLGATLGVALAPDDAAEPEMALRVADKAMMRAKRTSRGSIGYAVPHDSADLLNTAAILRAFDDDLSGHAALHGACVCLQPIVALGRAASPTPGLLGVEALARWHHPEVGQVPPSDLFPIIGAKRAALLSDRIREQGLAAFASLRERGLAPGRLALNLSAAEVSRPDIALLVAEQVERAGLSLGSVEIEITEDVLLEQVSEAILDHLAALRGRGARLVLDDFGAGHSGLAQLLRLPLDGVKLDRRFVQRLGGDLRAEAIVRATITLAHSLDLTVAAAGVETDQQAAALRKLGCDAAQGLLFGRPMPIDGLESWLRDRAVETRGVTVLRPTGTQR